MKLDFRTYRLLHFAFILIVGLLGVGLLYYLFEPEPQPDTHKFLMPGTYVVYLKPEKYGGWHFFKWKSKRISSDPLRIHVEIENLRDHKVHAYDDQRRTENFIDFDEFGRTGYRAFSFGVIEAGNYRIKCDQKCVFVLVPDNQQWVFRSSDTAFPGVFDDGNFSKPERLKESGGHDGLGYSSGN